MEKQYQALVNDKFKFDLTETSNSKTGRVLRAPDHTIENEDFLRREYVINLNGSSYKVKLLNELDVLIDELGLAVSEDALSNDLTAPMPGLIIDVLVKQGDEVKKGDGLIILEAMKMENKLTSVHDGVIRSISVKPGDTVDKGAVLIEFEKNENNQ